MIFIVTSAGLIPTVIVGGGYAQFWAAWQAGQVMSSLSKRTNTITCFWFEAEIAVVINIGARSSDIYMRQVFIPMRLPNLSTCCRRTDCLIACADDAGVLQLLDRDLPTRNIAGTV